MWRVFCRVLQKQLRRAPDGPGIRPPAQALRKAESPGCPMPSAQLVNWRLKLRAALPMLTGPGNPVGSCALPMPSDDPRHRQQAAAQRQRIGVWAVPGGIQRPWDWRKGTRPPAASTAAPFPPAAGSAPPAAAPAGGYSGRKLTCRQIGSYARAQELLRAGDSYLDRSGDGIACKSLRKV